MICAEHVTRSCLIGTAPLLPGSQVPGYTTGATALLGSDKPIATEVQFSIPLDFNGSDGIFFAPFGVQNDASLKSNWPDPAFRGAFLPADARCVRMDSMPSGKFRITGAIIRNHGRAVMVTSASRRARFQIHFSARSSY